MKTCAQESKPVGSVGCNEPLYHGRQFGPELTRRPAPEQGRWLALPARRAPFLRRCRWVPERLRSAGDRALRLIARLRLRRSRPAPTTRGSSGWGGERAGFRLLPGWRMSAVMADLFGAYLSWWRADTHSACHRFFVSRGTRWFLYWPTEWAVSSRWLIDGKYPRCVQIVRGPGFKPPIAKSGCISRITSIHG